MVVRCNKATTVTGNVLRDSPIKSAVPQAAPAPNNIESTITICRTQFVVVEKENSCTEEFQNLKNFTRTIK